jgi:hypothetical protein
MLNFMVFPKRRKILILFVLHAACRERAVDIILPFEGEKLVLWGKLEAGKEVNIQVMKTFSPVGEMPQVLSIENAQVYLYQEDSLLTKLQFLDSAGYYVASYRIQPGGRYRVKVEASGFPDAESELVEVPNAVPKLAFTRTKNAPSEFNPAQAFDMLSLRFEGGELLRSSYILVGFLSVFKEEMRSGFFLSKKSEVSTEDGCSSREYSRTTGFGNPALLRGACILSPVNFYIPANINGLPAGLPTSNQVQEIRLLTAAVSKEWFHYNLIDQQQPEGLDHLVLPPQKAYTNVKNGYGIIYGFLGKITEIENKTYTHEMPTTK